MMIICPDSFWSPVLLLVMIVVSVAVIVVVVVIVAPSGGVTKIGNGLDTSFWEEYWKGDKAFKILYPRIYALETCKQINVASTMAHDNLGFSLHRIPRSGVELEQFNDMSNSLVGFQLSNMKDRWFWSLSGSGGFLVASVRKFIDDHLLPKIFIVRSPLGGMSILLRLLLLKNESGCGGSSGGDCVGVVEMMMLVSMWCTGSGDGDSSLEVEMAEMEVAACWCWWVGGDVGWRSSHDGGDDVNVVTRVRR
ncbi:hypothetical protein Tco_1176342 [Tanacetum coccineum]